MLRKLIPFFILLVFVFVSCNKSIDHNGLSDEEVELIYNLAIYYNTWRPSSHERICHVVLMDNFSQDSVDFKTDNCIRSRIYSRRIFDSRLNGRTLKLSIDDSMLDFKKKQLINRHLESSNPKKYSLPVDFEYFNNHLYSGRLFGHRKSTYDKRGRGWSDTSHFSFTSIFYSPETNMAAMGYKNHVKSYGPPLVNLIFFKKLNGLWFAQHIYVEPM